MSESDPDRQGPWTPPRGLPVRIVAWIILLMIALGLFAMLAWALGVG